MKEKKFILRLVSFGFIFISIYTILLFLVGSLYNNLSFRINDAKNVLILGNSRGQYAINDSKMKNMFNISLESESYVYSYIKLKKIFEQNKQIDTVLLSHPYSVTIPDKLDVKNNRILSFIPKFYVWFDFEEFNLFKYYPKFWFAILKSPTKQLKIYNRNKRYNRIKDIGLGGYRASTMNYLDKDIENRKKDAIRNYKNYKNDIAQKYINKISELCLKNNSKLFLIQYPVLIQEIDTNLIKSYNAFNKEYLKGISIIDLNKKITLNKNHFIDISHLNSKGSDTLMSIIKKEGLRRVLLENTIDY